MQKYARKRAKTQLFFKNKLFIGFILFSLFNYWCFSCRMNQQGCQLSNCKAPLSPDELSIEDDDLRGLKNSEESNNDDLKLKEH